MRTEWDIVVLGAGPAGGTAARTAANAGADVLLLDEQKLPGGQVWRAKSSVSAAESSTDSRPEQQAGDAHRTALLESAVTFLGDTRLWHIEQGDGGWLLHVLTPSGTGLFRAKAVILAPGAREFVQPFPGWTLPGVFGLAGVTALMKSQSIAPGRRCVVAGSGPLPIFAAIQILRLGGEVEAIVTPNSRTDWVRSVPALIANPAIAAQGAGWIGALKRRGVPILWRHVVTRATGSPAIDTVHIARCTADWSPTGASRDIKADALCVGNGLVPNSDVAALAGLPLKYDPNCGSWVARAAKDGRTEIEGLYLCGDVAGILGAGAALEQGRQTGTSAAFWVQGCKTKARFSFRGVRANLLGHAMGQLSKPRPKLVDLTTPDTIVCRCENLRRETLDIEIDAGAASLIALKSTIRCGMGPCGGRFCLTGIARLTENRLNIAPGTILPATPRPPLFPLPIAEVGTEFEYDDLPIPAPAPL